MKEFPQSKPKSPAKPFEFVRMYLDIGQLRYIHAILGEKLTALNTQGLEDKNDALEQLVWHFRKLAYPKESKPLHVDDSFDKYIDDAEPDELGELLSNIYVEGVLNVQ